MMSKWCLEKGLEHRWVPGKLSGHPFCSKCGQPKGGQAAAIKALRAKFLGG